MANRSNGNRVLTLGGRALSLLVLRMSKSAYTDSVYTYTASSLLWAGWNHSSWNREALNQHKMVKKSGAPFHVWSDKQCCQACEPCLKYSFAVAALWFKWYGEGSGVNENKLRDRNPAPWTQDEVLHNYWNQRTQVSLILKGPEAKLWKRPEYTCLRRVCGEAV